MKTLLLVAYLIYNAHANAISGKYSYLQVFQIEADWVLEEN